MSEWKEEKQDDLVKRIQDTLNYLNCGVVHEHSTIVDILTRSKPEPAEPSHEEIMTLWWKDGTMWILIPQYDSNDKTYYISSEDMWRKKDYFTNRQSATIPPETE